MRYYIIDIVPRSWNADYRHISGLRAWESFEKRKELEDSEGG
jgi:hypothetical protein